MDVSQIDLDGLTYNELLTLNRRIVDRLNLLQRVRANQQMLKFNVGDEV